MRRSTRTRFLVDSGIIIRLLRGDRRAGLLLDRLRDSGLLSTSAIAAFEVFRGCRNDREHQAAERVFAQLMMSDLAYDSALVAADLMRTQSGVFSGEKSIPDALIAATAIVDDAALVTLNTRQFSRVRAPGLELLLVDQDSPDWIAAVT